jgi:Zn-dependent protease with chaperone function
MRLGRTARRTDGAVPRRLSSAPWWAAAAAVAALATTGACTPRYAPPPVADRAELLAVREVLAAPPVAAEARGGPVPAADGASRIAAVARRVSDAAQPVCAAHLGRACPLQVELDPSGVPRAQATGSGRIVVTAGMVRLLEEDDALAAVVAHEAGHHLAGHIGRRFVRGLAAGTAASAVLGAVLPFGGLLGWALGQGAAEAGAGASRLAFSKEEEREADYLAAYLVARAGYDPERAGRLWGLLAPHERGRETGPLDTHPAGADRLAAWRRAVEEIRGSADLMPRRFAER